MKFKNFTFNNRPECKEGIYHDMNRLIHTITRWPKTVIAIILVISVPFGYGFFQKSFFNHVSLYFDQNDPSMITYERFKETYGNEETALIALHADTLFTNRTLDIIRQISTLAKSTPGIQRVFSLTEATQAMGFDDTIEFVPIVPEGHLDRAALQKVRQQAMHHEILSRTLLSEDGTTTAILLELAPIASAEEKGKMLESIAVQAKQIAGNDVSLHFSGTPFVEYEINNLTQRDDGHFTPITLLVIFGLSTVFLRRFSLSVLCLLNILVILLWAVGIYVLSGNSFNMVTVVMPPILLAISVADGIHILSHFAYHHYELGKSRRDAAVETAIRLWLPCLFTSLTTGIGFLSFLTAAIGPVRTLGVYTFTGVMIAFAITITMLPALLILLPLKPTHRHSLTGSTGVDARPPSHMTGLIQFIAETTIQHYKAYALFFTLITIAALVGAAQIRYETNFANHLHESNPIKQGIRFIEEHLFGTVPVVLLIRAESADDDFTHPKSLKLIDTIQAELKNEFKGKYTSFFSIVDYLKGIHRAFNEGKDQFYAIPDNPMDILDYYEIGESDTLERIITPDWMEARISFSAHLGPIDGSKNLDHYLRTHVQKMTGKAFTYELTGSSSLYVALDSNLRKSQARSFTSAFIVIFIMMFFICRNLKLTLISILANLFPIICTFGLMGFLNIPLDVSTIMIASVTIGIAVDDTIHFIVWYRRNTQYGLDMTAALQKTFQDTGKPILITSILLSISFAILIAGSVKPVQAFGMLAGLAMLFAVIGDLFMLPALILVFKPRLPQTNGHTPRLNKAQTVDQHVGSKRTNRTNPSIRNS